MSKQHDVTKIAVESSPPTAKKKFHDLITTNNNNKCNNKKIVGSYLIDNDFTYIDDDTIDYNLNNNNNNCISTTDVIKNDNNDEANDSSSKFYKINQDVNKFNKNQQIRKTTNNTNTSSHNNKKEIYNLFIVEDDDDNDDDEDIITENNCNNNNDNDKKMNELLNIDDNKTHNHSDKKLVNDLAIAVAAAAKRKLEIGKNNQQNMCGNDEIIRKQFDNNNCKKKITKNDDKITVATGTLVIPPTVVQHSIKKCIRKVKMDNCEVKAKMSVVKPQEKQEQQQQQQQQQPQQSQQQQQQQYACDNDKNLIKLQQINNIHDNNNNKNYIVTNIEKIDKINVKCVSNNNSESNLTEVCDKTSNDTCVNMLKKSESDDKFINCINNGNCDLVTEDGEDPYAELEMYLAKVTNEISEVFQQLNVNEEQEIKNVKTIKKSPLDITASNLSTHKSMCNVDDVNTDNKLVILNIDNNDNHNENCIDNQLNDNKNIINDKVIRRCRNILPVTVMTGGNDCIINKTLRQRNESEWTKSIMVEFDDIVESEIRNLTRHDQDNENINDDDNIDGDNNDTGHYLSLYNYNNNLVRNSNVLKPENQNLVINELKTAVPDNNSMVTKKPPINYLSNKKLVTDDLTVLKIEEDTNNCSNNSIDMPCELSMQTSPKLNASKKEKGSISSVWTSEESILRGVDAIDEDNKSSSSSVSDGGSAMLSSGKSGNSLNSSELENDNIESGIGTATPPKDQDSWKRLRCVQSLPKEDNRTMHSNNKNIWIRHNNSTTQINNTYPRHQKLIKSHSIVSADEPDSMEALSLYGDNNDDDDDDFIFDTSDNLSDKLRAHNNSNSNNNTKSTDTSFGTDSSSSTKISFDDDNDLDVVLRNKCNTTSGINLNKKMCYSSINRSAISFPLNFTKKINFMNKQTDELFSNSLPYLKKIKPTDDDNNKSINKINNNNNDCKIEYCCNQRPFCLPIDHDLYRNTSSNIVELPSPSSASLHSGLGNLMSQELSIKSSSAPILLKKEKKHDDFGAQTNLRYSRSQSDRYLAEIEAMEACKWLRAAGFPQYAQMYEDHQFPIDLSGVAKDHPFLENDPLQSLYRRLFALNRCATMRLDGTHHNKHNTNNYDSDDDSCALSENWTFQQQSRRWSRVGDMGQMSINIVGPQQQQQNDKLNNDKINYASRESTPERYQPQSTGDIGFSTLPLGVSVQPSEDPLQVRFRRSGSERLKDGAKAILRRVESIKSRRKKRQNRDGVVISGPQVLDLSDMNQRMNELKCVDVVACSNPSSPLPISPLARSPSNQGNELKVASSYESSSNGKCSPNRLSPKHYVIKKSNETAQQTPMSANRTSPLHFFGQHAKYSKETKSGDESSSYCSDASLDSGSMSAVKKKPSRAKRFLQRGSKIEDAGALSDSECHQHNGRKQNFKYFKDANSNNTELKVPTIARGGSLNLGKESKRYREGLQQRSLRSRSSTRYRSKEPTADSDRDEDIVLRSSRGSVIRWHSFQSSERPVTKLSTKSQEFKNENGIQLAAMSSGQLQVIRKLALVTLTGHMERHCPTHRSGWNWELPKFIKKIKTPDYKDKKVFGVPLLLVLQRTCQSLPLPIQTALRWLKMNAVDQIGVFRKSGVKSRILKLRSVVEVNDKDLLAIFDGHQAYDVADMVKQYFRELPESLLTNKMSETFVAIFQHLPVDVRADAVQSAILLLPDEHREVLYSLLEFLYHVAENAVYNQMTANNLAVCLAPSLFHNGIANSRSHSASPRRRKATGMPDAKELSETKASHECLTFLIENHRSIFSITNEKMSRCNFGYMEESRPVPLEQLGEGLQVHDWRGYLYECTTATIKEGREKSRGWISSGSFDPHVDIAYKKVGDGHPLRLWRCTTEVEAPPLEVLHHIVKERHIWDVLLLKWRIVQQLDEHSEVFQYVCGGQTVTDFCVLRSWRSDLQKGACVIVETSVEHPDAPLLMGGVRGVVLASRYLIEPCGSGKSRIMHLVRTDIKGRSPEWYNKSFGHITSQYLTRIRNSFKHITEGPESKV